VTIRAAFDQGGEWAAAIELRSRKRPRAVFLGPELWPCPTQAQHSTPNGSRWPVNWVTAQRNSLCYIPEK
jgi:hypothetical protein